MTPLTNIKSMAQYICAKVGQVIKILSKINGHRYQLHTTYNQIKYRADIASEIRGDKLCEIVIVDCDAKNAVLISITTIPSALYCFLRFRCDIEKIPTDCPMQVE